MNVLPTTGCACATCEYLRRTAAAAPTVNPQPFGPAPTPWPIAPPSPIDQGWQCACGQRVYSMQVHRCPYSGITCSVPAEPAVNLTPSQSTLGKWVAIPGPSERPST